MCLPGGVGTLDETFELLTLTQTGKGRPVPIVLLDEPNDPYWESVHGLMLQLVRRGMVSAGDTALYTITDSVDEARRSSSSSTATTTRSASSASTSWSACVRGRTTSNSPCSTSSSDTSSRSGSIDRAEPFKIERSRRRQGRPRPDLLRVRQARLQRPGRDDPRAERLRLVELTKQTAAFSIARLACISFLSSTGRASSPSATASAEAIERHLVEVGGDRLEPFDQLGILPHHRPPTPSASATRSTGCLTGRSSTAASASNIRGSRSPRRRHSIARSHA